MSECKRSGKPAPAGPLDRKSGREIEVRWRGKKTCPGSLCLRVRVRKLENIGWVSGLLSWKGYKQCAGKCITQLSGKTKQLSPHPLIL